MLPGQTGASSGGLGTKGGGSKGHDHMSRREERNVVVIVKVRRTASSHAPQEGPRPSTGPGKSHAKVLYLCTPGCQAGPVSSTSLPLTQGWPLSTSLALRTPQSRTAASPSSARVLMGTHQLKATAATGQADSTSLWKEAKPWDKRVRLATPASGEPQAGEIQSSRVQAPIIDPASTSTTLRPPRDKSSDRTQQPQPWAVDLGIPI